MRLAVATPMMALAGGGAPSAAPTPFAAGAPVLEALAETSVAVAWVRGERTEFFAAKGGRQSREVYIMRFALAFSLVAAAVGAADLPWLELAGTNRSPSSVSASVICATPVAAVKGDVRSSAEAMVSTFAPGVLLFFR